MWLSIGEVIEDDKHYFVGIIRDITVQKNLEEQQQKYVREAIQKLPKIEALLITLYYLEENSVKEIQDITGLTAENIKIRLFRARKKLEQSLRFLM